MLKVQGADSFLRIWKSCTFTFLQRDPNTFPTSSLLLTFLKVHAIQSILQLGKNTPLSHQHCQLKHVPVHVIPCPLSLILVLPEQSDTVMGRNGSKSGRENKSLRDQKLSGSMRTRRPALGRKKYLLLSLKSRTDRQGSSVVLGHNLPLFCSFTESWLRNNSVQCHFTSVSSSLFVYSLLFMAEEEWQAESRGVIKEVSQIRGEWGNA